MSVILTLEILKMLNFVSLAAGLNGAIPVVPAWAVKYGLDKGLDYVIEFLKKPENIEKAKKWIHDELTAAAAKTEGDVDDRLVKVWDAFVGYKG